MDTGNGNNFKSKVYELVSQVPEGKVMTYGDVAAICGSPYAARQVGQIAHFGPSEIPWQRVVNRRGGLARAYSFGGLDGHKAALEADGVEISDDYRVAEFSVKRWSADGGQVNLR